MAYVPNHMSYTSFYKKLNCLTVLSHQKVCLRRNTLRRVTKELEEVDLKIPLPVHCVDYQTYDNDCIVGDFKGEGQNETSLLKSNPVEGFLRSLLKDYLRLGRIDEGY